MFKIGFKDRYKVLHINNELGNHLVGGAGTYMNEMYRYHKNDTGFVHINTGSCHADLDLSDYPQAGDIAIMHVNESARLSEMDFDIMVIQFYEFADCITEEILKNRKLAYVIHSVPTPEPASAENPFGGNAEVRRKFEFLCDRADVLICVSNAEKEKLASIYPQHRQKIKVVHNGITVEKEPVPNENHLKSRRVFGYIGRTDYRKGILECIRAIRNTDSELHIACPKNDSGYMEKILLYTEAAGMQDRVQFHGWCVGRRKKNFLDSLDALIIPSLYEPFGYVALEAMQCGLPLISSNNGGLDEILQDYRYKYDPYKEDALENTIKMFQNDSSEIIHGQQEILSQNLKRFHAKDMAEKYENIWEELLNG